MTDKLNYTTGPTYSGPPRANPDLLEQTRPGEHVWITVASWRVDGKKILAAEKQGEEVFLTWDAENLASFNIGCYVCEEPFSERLYHRKCTGEPGSQRL